MTNALDGGLDIGPSSNDGTEDHQAERKQGHGGDAAAEPEDLTISDNNDGQVLEDGVHGDGEELERLGAGIDHAHEQQRDREPCFAAACQPAAPNVHKAETREEGRVRKAYISLPWSSRKQRGSGTCPIACISEWRRYRPETAMIE